MNGEALQKGKRVFDRTQLEKLKLRALRQGLWFRLLERIDRAIIDLSITVNAKFRSSRLVSSIQSVISKLEGSFGSCLVKAISELGIPETVELSFFAQKWGNKDAAKWAEDVCFARYLSVMKLNNPYSGVKTIVMFN